MQDKTSFIPMVIIGILFFIFGFVTWLNGSLIPFLKTICDLNDFESLFVTFSFYIAYTLMAMPMSYVLERIGYKKGMALGLGIMSIGSLIFIPAAMSASYVVFLAALFTLASGLTILQSASNPYVVYLGDINSAAMRISIMGVINKAAGVLAPLLFSMIVFFDGGIENKEILASKLIAPYIGMAIILFLLIWLVRFLPDLDLNKKDDEVLDKSIFEFPRVVLGAVALFFYVGIEVIAGDTIGLYGQSLGVQNYTILTSYTMVFMVFGYFIGIFFIPKYLSQQKALLFSALFGVIFLVGVVLSSNAHTLSSILWGWSGVPTIPNSVVFVALLGFANALVWPSIWPLALDGIGKYSTKASALLIMAIAGGALLPLLFGKVASITTMQSAYTVGIVCYVVIFMYAFKWHKVESWRELW